MSFEGLTTPTAQDGEYGPVVMFDDGKHIPCGSMIEAEALAEAWRRWPRSEHRPVEESRNRWRTGFADGAEWAANRTVRSAIDDGHDGWCGCDTCEANRTNRSEETR